MSVTYGNYSDGSDSVRNDRRMLLRRLDREISQLRNNGADEKIIEGVLIARSLVERP